MLRFENIKKIELRNTFKLKGNMEEFEKEMAILLQKYDLHSVCVQIHKGLVYVVQKRSSKERTKLMKAVTKDGSVKRSSLPVEDGDIILLKRKQARQVTAKCGLKRLRNELNDILRDLRYVRIIEDPNDAMESVVSRIEKDLLSLAKHAQEQIAANMGEMQLRLKEKANKKAA